MICIVKDWWILNTVNLLMAISEISADSSVEPLFVCIVMRSFMREFVDLTHTCAL